MEFLKEIFDWRGKKADEAEGTMEGRRFVESIVKIHTKLQGLTDLRPCSEVNELFDELVRICIQMLPDQVTRQVRQRDFPRQYSVH
jgi:hypothetical protein